APPLRLPRRVAIRIDGTKVTTRHLHPRYCFYSIGRPHRVCQHKPAGTSSATGHPSVDTLSKRSMSWGIFSTAWDWREGWEEDAVRKGQGSLLRVRRALLTVRAPLGRPRASARVALLHWLPVAGRNNALKPVCNCHGVQGSMACILSFLLAHLS